MNPYQRDLKSQRRGGFYWIHNVPYVSVTNVLSIIDKPALRYWFGKEVYYAMVKNPTLQEQAALSAPYDKSDEAKNRGTTVHSIVEFYKDSQEHVDSVPEEYRGYAQGFRNWLKDNDVEIITQEKTIVSRQYGFAGTLDLLVKFRQSNKVYLVDIKTGKDIYPEAFLQLSAYKQGLKEENIHVDHLSVLLLRPTGTYKFEQNGDLLDVYLAAKKIWEWKNDEMMGKMGVPKQLPLQEIEKTPQPGATLVI